MTLRSIPVNGVKWLLRKSIQYQSHLQKCSSLLCLADLENCGLFWSLCSKNDSEKPDGSRRKTSGRWYKWETFHMRPNLRTCNVTGRGEDLATRV